MRRFLLAAIAAALWTGGCGHVGDPLAPRANVPGRILDLVAVQRGDTLWVRFTAPPRTTEGVAIAMPLQFELRAGPGINPFDLHVWLEHAASFQPSSVQNGVVTYQILAGPWAGKEIVVVARAIGANGKDSAWTPPEAIPVVAAPPPPQDLKTQATAEGVRLTWNAAAGTFRVFRQTANPPGLARLADVNQPTYTDATAEFDKRYAYIVQRIEKLAGGEEAESEPSPESVIVPKDTFPPALPSGLHASLAPSSIEIAWAQNTEPDLAGYRVFRSVNGGEFERIAEVSQIPAYSDHAVEAGKTYRYAISAFDQSGNPSALSAPVEVVMQ